MNAKLAEKILKRCGWTILRDCLPDEKSVVILMAPHTSFEDFLWGYLYYAACGRKLSVVIKKELFFWPLGPVLRSLGCVPVDRKSPARMIISTIEALTKPMKDTDSDYFHLAMCPEGTREVSFPWKTGYHTLVSRSGVPLYLSTVDYKRKQVGIFQRFDLSGDVKKDTADIMAIYASHDFGAKYPEKYRAE